MDHRPADEAEDAYRVGESRSNYSSIVPGDRTAIRDECVSVVFRVLEWWKCKTPHLALGTGGAWFPLPRLNERLSLGTVSSGSASCAGRSIRARISRGDRVELFEFANARDDAERRAPRRGTQPGGLLSRAVELVGRERHQVLGIRRWALGAGQNRCQMPRTGLCRHDKS